MGKNKGRRVDRSVEFTKRCEKEYKKFKKRADPNLLRAIESKVREIAAEPKIGKELSRDFEGYNSVRLDEYSFRIVYFYDDQRVIVHAIGHRNRIYEDMSRRLS